MRIERYGALLATVLLASCQAAQPLTEAQAAARRPAGAHLAALYDASCRSCHTRRDSGAPLSGDHTQWDARWAKGPDTLLQHAVAGYNAMPAGGQCATCTAAYYTALIRFMADQRQ